MNESEINCKEQNVVGSLIFHLSNNFDEIIEYYNDDEMINEYKDAINSMGINGVSYKVNKTNTDDKDYLVYNLKKIEIEEYGEDYTYEEYLKSKSKEDISNMSILEDYGEARKQIGAEKYDAIEEYINEVCPLDKQYLFNDELKKIINLEGSKWLEEKEKLEKKYGVIYLSDVLYKKEEWEKFDKWYEENRVQNKDLTKTKGAR